MYTYCIAMNMHYIYIHLSMKCMEMPSYVIGPSSSSSARDACHPVASLGRKLSNWRWYDRLWYCCLELMAILKGCVQWVAFVRGTQNEVSKAQIGSSSFQSCIIRIQGVGDWSSSMPFQLGKPTLCCLVCMNIHLCLPWFNPSITKHPHMFERFQRPAGASKQFCAQLKSGSSFRAIWPGCDLKTPTTRENNYCPARKRGVYAYMVYKYMHRLSFLYYCLLRLYVCFFWS